MSLKFLVDEYEESKEEIREKVRNTWTAILLGSWITYVFWGMVVTTLTMISKPLLYWSAMTESLWLEILLKSIVFIIAGFNVAVICTWIKGSEFWRRLKVWWITPKIQAMPKGVAPADDD